MKKTITIILILAGVWFFSSRVVEETPTVNFGGTAPGEEQLLIN